MMTYPRNLLSLVLTVGTLVWRFPAVTSQLLRSTSPDSEFLTQPSNVTVPEGERAILKCLIARQTHLCRWYFLELGLDFFDKRVSPVLVKNFNPSRYKDCSIKINKVRKIQEGQWLCQALTFQSSEFLLSKPAILRVITEAESATWVPPPDQPHLTPRQGRHGNDSHNKPEFNSNGGKTLKTHVLFDSTHEDYIQDVPIGESAVLKCQINKPISSCSWIMPQGDLFKMSQDAEHSNKPSKNMRDYRLQGDTSEGNCTLHIREVRQQDEGNWRCVVRIGEQQEEFQGPLLHLHIIDTEHPSSHNHEGTPLVAPNDDSMNFLVIGLVFISTILFITVITLFTCLYRRMNTNSEETRKILNFSPRNSMDFPCKTLPTTDFTTTSVMAVEPRKKLPPQYTDLDHYNQYLDMTGVGSSVDGYIMMPGSSIRSSASSRTTLSTLSTLPIGRSRSASNSTTISADSPHVSTVVDNPSYDPDVAVDRRGFNLSRPPSTYSTYHIYEEIKEKKDDSAKMEKIVEATTPESPTYTNTIEDCEGYMIPKKSSSSEALPVPQPQETLETIYKLPLPDPTQDNTSGNTPIQSKASDTGQAPPYSRIGESGLVPASPITQTSIIPGPGYSRVGTPGDPMERYDTPRPVPSDPMEQYDVPRHLPSGEILQPNIPVTTEVSVNGLEGTIV
ncbi:uncharacterized protein LOC121880171 [Homarus americanus]|uniref:uncharacterized protein LOC121880171 n=1 Tax=Homarus americanus TaxID=6706 RepID=UPI001C47D63D|nr:uncharacterized protein LOC121880171 [Homarus americanus]